MKFFCNTIYMNVEEINNIWVTIEWGKIQDKTHAVLFLTTCFANASTGLWQQPNKYLVINLLHYKDSMFQILLWVQKVFFHN